MSKIASSSRVWRDLWTSRRVSRQEQALARTLEAAWRDAYAPEGGPHEALDAIIDAAAQASLRQSRCFGILTIRPAAEESLSAPLDYKRIDGQLRPFEFAIPLGRGEIMIAAAMLDDATDIRRRADQLRAGMDRAGLPKLQIGSAIYALNGYTALDMIAAARRDDAKAPIDDSREQAPLGARFEFKSAPRSNIIAFPSSNRDIFWNR